MGTRKGLFLIREDGSERALERPLLPGWEIHYAVLDARDGSLYACTKKLGLRRQRAPPADLLRDEAGEVRPLVNVYVDGERARDLAAPLAPNARVRIVAAVAGG